MKKLTHTTSETEVINEIETSEHAGLSKVTDTTDVITTTTDNGVRITRVLVMRRFADSEWILKNVVAEGKGAKKSVARIIGACIGFDRKDNEYQGKKLESIALKGTFEGTSYVTGEVIQATAIYLPMAYAEQVAMLFLDDEIKMVELDLDIGIEATGKAIPYEWTCTSFVEGGESNILKRLRSRRKPPVMLEHQQQKLIG